MVDLSNPANLPKTTLVLGGARSGKSAYAEGLIAAHGGGTYLATAEAGDAEMTERIRRHQERRGPKWETVEEPLDLVSTLQGLQGNTPAILVDCLTLWISNLMAAARDMEGEFMALGHWMDGAATPTVFVANEVGQGIVPENALARRFRDLAGSLNQLVAARARHVVLVTAGLPVQLKPTGVHHA